MTESKAGAQPASAAGNVRTTGTGGGTTAMPSAQQDYKKEQTRLREMIEKQRNSSKKLGLLEETIAQKEAAYLDATPDGNIITGYNGYIKGAGGAGGQRRKTHSTDQNRVFSRSSVSYKPNMGDMATPASMGSTPASHAPTPLSTSFKDGGSGHATPTSTTATKSNKKKKNDDDSEPESAQVGKKRTTFGAGRK